MIFPYLIINDSLIPLRISTLIQVYVRSTLPQWKH